MAEKKVERITTEKILEEKNYFKEIESKESGKVEIVKTSNFDKKESYREYGVKTLQSYIKEIEDFRTNKNYKVHEHYFRKGVEIKLSDLSTGSGLTEMLALLSKEIKSAEITRVFNLITGGIIQSAEITYNVELF